VTVDIPIYRGDAYAPERIRLHATCREELSISYTGGSAAERMTARALALCDFAASADAQQRFVCDGEVSGVPTSQAMLELTPDGLYNDGPGVAGWIRNQFAQYSFSGIMYSGNEGYVALAGHHSGERIHRVWIGVSATGFALRTEDGAVYSFLCG
jgi:hypothetical protein